MSKYSVYSLSIRVTDENGYGDSYATFYDGEVAHVQRALNSLVRAENRMFDIINGSNIS